MYGCVLKCWYMNKKTISICISGILVFNQFNSEFLNHKHEPVSVTPSTTNYNLPYTISGTANYTGGTINISNYGVKFSY